MTLADKVGEQKGSTIRHSKAIDESDNTENKENVEPDSDEEIFTPKRKRKKSCLIESDVEDTCDDNNGSLEDKGEVKANVEHESESEDQEEIITPRRKRKKSSIVETDSEDDAEETKMSESIAKIENSPDKEDAAIEIVCKTEPGKS